MGRDDVVDILFLVTMANEGALFQQPFVFGNCFDGIFNFCWILVGDFEGGVFPQESGCLSLIR